MAQLFSVKRAGRYCSRLQMKANTVVAGLVPARLFNKGAGKGLALPLHKSAFRRLSCTRMLIAGERVA